MRVALHGPVTTGDLDEAELFAGIAPSALVHNGDHKPPLSLPTETILREPKIPGEPGDLQNDWRLVLAADAVVIRGNNDHLRRIAEDLGLPVHVAG